MRNKQNWYALKCKPFKGDWAVQNLENQGIEAVFFKCEERRGRRSVIQPLFSWYVFARFAAWQYSTVNNTRGVRYVITSSPDNPVSVPEPIMREIFDRVDERGVVPLQSQKPLERGDLVEVSLGPFAGFTAVFQEMRGPERARILLCSVLGGQEWPMELPANYLTPLPAVAGNTVSN